MEQVLITLDDGRQVLVDRYISGEVEVSQRDHEGAGWLPVGVNHFAGSVKVIRVDA